MIIIYKELINYKKSSQVCRSNTSFKNKNRGWVNKMTIQRIPNITDSIAKEKFSNIRFTQFFSEFEIMSSCVSRRGCVSEIKVQGQINKAMHDFIKQWQIVKYSLRRRSSVSTLIKTSKRSFKKNCLNHTVF